MQMQVEPNYIRNIALTLVVLIACAFSFLGFRAGRDAAKAELTLVQVKEIMSGLERFYADQDRYPTTIEFLDSQKFGIYLVGVPVMQQGSKLCPSTISYSTFNARTFVLSYCLPRSVGEYAAGTYKLTERDFTE